MRNHHGQRKQQLLKAYTHVVRHECKKFIDQCTSAINDLIREKVLLPDDSSCVLKKVTPEGDAYFDVTVTVPVHKIRIDCRLE